MQHQTREVVQFVIEVYELTHWNYNTNGYVMSYFYEDGHYKKVNSEHWFVNPSCYKKVYYKRVNSVKKLHYFLGINGNKKKSYSFYTTLEDAIKGYFGYKSSVVRSAPEKVFVVKQLHNLEQKYFVSFYKK